MWTAPPQGSGTVRIGYALYNHSTCITILVSSQNLINFEIIIERVFLFNRFAVVQTRPVYWANQRTAEIAERGMVFLPCMYSYTIWQAMSIKNTKANVHTYQMERKTYAQNFQRTRWSVNIFNNHARYISILA